MPEILRAIAVVFVGVFSGALSALFGVGGAVVSTPAIRALGVSAELAIGTTLPCVIPGAITGSFRYAKAQLLVWRIFWVVAPFGAAAAIGGAIAAENMPGEGHYLMIATAALVLWTAYRMTITPKPHLDHTQAKTWQLVLLAILAGGLSGLLGVGGGFVLVPVFVTYLGMQMRQAVATSLACVAVFVIPGTITHAFLGNIDWTVALLLTIGVVPSVWLTSRYVVRVDDKPLRIAMAVFLCIVAVVFGAAEIVSLTSV